MTPEQEKVLSVYPEAEIINGWALTFDKPRSKAKVRGIQIKDNNKTRWLLFREIYRRVPDERLWAAGWLVIQKKMLRMFQS